MEEPQNPYAENQEPENKPSSDANETQNEWGVTQCCLIILLIFIVGLFAIILFDSPDPASEPQSRRRRFDQLIEELLVSGADINSIDFQGRIHKAVEAEDIESVKKLLASGADIDFMEYMTGEAPLHRAVTLENTAMVKLLIDSGADLNLPHKDDGQTPLDMAQDKGLVEIEQLLRANGASLSQ